MIIRFFKSSYLIQYAALFVVGIVLWFPSFLQSEVIEISSNQLLEPGYDLVMVLFYPKSISGIIASFIITMSSAFLLNFVLERHDLTARNSLLPAFTYILITGIFHDMHWFHQNLIPFLLLIFLVNFMLEMYNTEEGYAQIFYGGSLIALSSLFSFQSIFFIIFVVFSFFVFRIYQWREWIITFLGIINTYLLLWVYFFWIDDLNVVFESYGAFFSNLSLFSYNGPFGFLDLLLLSSIVLLGLWALFKILISYGDHILIVRKKITIILWFAFVALLITIFIGGSGDTFYYFFISSLVAVICLGLAHVKKTIWMDATLGLLLLLALVNNYTRLLS